MRWPKNKRKPKLAERRTVGRFLVWPLLMDGQWRWLEKAWITQVYVGDGAWNDTHWADPP